MKLYENHFEEYINQVKNNNLHQEKEIDSTASTSV